MSFSSPSVQHTPSFRGTKYPNEELQISPALVETLLQGWISLLLSYLVVRFLEGLGQCAQRWNLMVAGFTQENTGDAYLPEDEEDDE